MLLQIIRESKHSYPYGMLHPDARIAIGLEQSANIDRREAAGICGVTYQQYQAFMARLYRNKISNWILHNGLPASFGYPLEKVSRSGHKRHVVRCLLCNKRIYHVPCVSCCTFEGAQSRNDHEPELPFSTLGTDAMPGSRRKIEVMRDRAKRGETIFSDLDRRDAASAYKGTEYTLPKAIEETLKSPSKRQITSRGRHETV